MLIVIQIIIVFIDVKDFVNIDVIDYLTIDESILLLMMFLFKLSILLLMMFLFKLSICY